MFTFHVGLQPCQDSAGEKTDSEHMLGPRLKSVLEASNLSKPWKLEYWDTPPAWEALGKPGGAKKQGLAKLVLCIPAIFLHTETHRVCGLGQWISTQIRRVWYSALCLTLYTDTLPQAESARQRKFHQENVELDLNINHDGKKTIPARSLAMTGLYFTDGNFHLVSVIYGDSHGQGIITLVCHRQFSSTRILQQPRFPAILGKKNK